MKSGHWYVRAECEPKRYLFASAREDGTSVSHTTLSEITDRIIPRGIKLHVNRLVVLIDNYYIRQGRADYVVHGKSLAEGVAGIIACQVSANRSGQWTICNGYMLVAIEQLM